jgi:TaqI-like C-terminal specificity domain
MERSVKLLSKRFTSFIVPDQVGHLVGYGSIREVLLKYGTLVDVRYWGENVFKGVTTPALTFVIDKSYAGLTTIVDKDERAQVVQLLPGDVWGQSESRVLLQKISERSFSLKPFLADCGIRTTNASEQVVELSEAKGRFLPTLEGKQVGRYWCGPPKVGVRLDTDCDLFKSRDEKYTSALFVIRQTAAYPIVGPHEHTTYFRNSLHALRAPEEGPDARYLVGLLNSKLLRFCYVETIREAQQRAFPQVKLGALGGLPMRVVETSGERARCDEIVKLVEQMLVLQRKLRSEGNPLKVDTLSRQAEVLDGRIDLAVYALYELTETEVQTVEDVVSKLVTPP